MVMGALQFVPVQDQKNGRLRSLANVHLNLVLPTLLISGSKKVQAILKLLGRWVCPQGRSLVLCGAHCDLSVCHCKGCSNLSPPPQSDHTCLMEAFIGVNCDWERSLVCNVIMAFAAFPES